jgi:hypothetical protein
VLKGGGGGILSLQVEEISLWIKIGQQVVVSKFFNALLKLGFIQFKSDYSLFTRLDRSSFIALLIYVHNIVLVGNDVEALSFFTKLLNQQLKLKDLGDLKFFLGLEIARKSTSIPICQRKYAHEILDDYGLLACKPSKFPMDSNLRISMHEGLLLDYPTSYRRLVGRLLYLTITWHDLVYSIQVLSKFMF